MHDLVAFGWIVLLASAALGLAIGSRAFSERLSIPAPAVFLLAAAHPFLTRGGKLQVVEAVDVSA